MTIRYGLARIFSKRGICSRTEATRWIEAGRVRCEGRIVRDPQFPTSPDARIEIEGVDAAKAETLVVMLNKPRGLVTTRSDPRGRVTVYSCFEGASLPWLAPVGRLDQASEGLLLFTNDPAFADRLNSPSSHVVKTYHVQVDRVPTEADLAALRDPIEHRDERLSALAVEVLRAGEKNAWLEFRLDEGKNRQIRRMLASRDFEVLRLVRVAVGALPLGELGKGQWRVLDADDIEQLTR